ncbi:hypothetical protein DAPPUDRAFT_239444 [Daphnia pulex]|uniref:Uncharacterized protein n=1 Tax=Daphnia pulex TaxID=6669 RepID=E9G9C9_DAPPU|nr:hypothetical protein DAPPUDRAFT_239444 [Daphnia pulex]|eukprot:EFX83543.1 hypothetical protein DAPPUDRAFT_239444 [Daphnia pulex]
MAGFTGIDPINSSALPLYNAAPIQKLKGVEGHGEDKPTAFHDTGMKWDGDHRERDGKNQDFKKDTTKTPWKDGEKQDSTKGSSKNPTNDGKNKDSQKGGGGTNSSNSYNRTPQWGEVRYN